MKQKKVLASVNKDRMRMRNRMKKVISPKARTPFQVLIPGLVPALLLRVAQEGVHQDVRTHLKCLLALFF